MYEHVGRHRLDEYFTAARNLMAPDALLLNSEDCPAENHGG